MKLEINNLSGGETLENVEFFVSGVLEFAESFLKKKEIINQSVELSVALVDEEEIKKLNFEYRKKNSATDVLSFVYNENGDGIIQGELILCPEVIDKNAEEDNIKFKDEFTKNIIHGFLHIVGYEHGDEMFSFQKEMCEKIKENSK